MRAGHDSLPSPKVEAEMPDEPQLFCVLDAGSSQLTQQQGLHIPMHSSGWRVPRKKLKALVMARLKQSGDERKFTQSELVALGLCTHVSRLTCMVNKPTSDVYLLLRIEWLGLVHVK